MSTEHNHYVEHVVDGINHYVIDTDSHFKIDPVTREVTNVELKKTNLMQFDHNSERLSFEIDKMIEGHDMSLCNKVEVHYININASTRTTNPGVYEVEDFAISASDENKLLFTWLISENATQHAGPLNFLILFSCVDDGDHVIYRWNTGINNTISIANGMNNGAAITEEYPDILAQWRYELFKRNYAYEGAVANGYAGTEEEWYDLLQQQAQNSYLWEAKQNNMDWVTEEDIDAMFNGTYAGTEDETTGKPYLLIPSDYAQNDPTEADYIKNRPFYDDIIETEYDTVEIKFTVDETGNSKSVTIVDRDGIGLIPSQTYGVSLTGYQGSTRVNNIHKFVRAYSEGAVVLKYNGEDIVDFKVYDYTSSDAYDDEGRRDVGIYIKVNAETFGVCDNYILTITGNLSRVEPHYLEMKYIQDGSITTRKLNSQVTQDILGKMEDRHIPDTIARTTDTNAKIESTKSDILDNMEDDKISLEGLVDSRSIKLTSQGSMHALSDSAEAPIPSMRIFGKTKQATTTGKNKLVCPYESPSGNYSGVIATVNGDGSVLLNGTSTSSQVTNFYFHFTNKITLPAGNYTVGGVASNDCYMMVYDPSISEYRTTKSRETISLNLTEESQIAVLVQWSAKAVINNVLVKPFIVEADKYDGNWEPYTGGMPSPNPSYPQALESVGDDGSVEQFVKGKNLIDISQYAKTSYANTVLDEDRLTVTGYLTYVDVYGLEVGKKYTYSWKAVKSSEYGGGFALERFYTDGTRKLIVSSAEHLPERSPYTFTMAENVEFLRFYFYGGKTNINDNPTTATYYDVQLEEGETATPYEPYKSQSLTIPTPNGLPGIPVSSGGNYTDKDGHQYVSDYKDYERMVYVQRVGEYRNTGEAMEGGTATTESATSKTVYWNHRVTGVKPGGLMKCNCMRNVQHGSYSIYAVFAYSTIPNYIYFTAPKEIIESCDGSNYREKTNAWLAKTFSEENPLIVLYELETPIETPLSEEEIAAYKALHTNYPNTTIYNDDGAYTEVKYVADTKNYVDNKIANEVAKLTATTEG